MDNEQYAKVKDKRDSYREMIWNEQSVLHHRVAWLIQINAFLFVGYYTVKISDNLKYPEKLYFISTISLLAIVFCSLILSMLAAVVTAWKDIYGQWVRDKKDFAGPDIFGMAPPFDENGIKSIFPYLSAENFLPAIFILFWLNVFLFERHQAVGQENFDLIGRVFLWAPIASVFLILAGIIFFWVWIFFKRTKKK